MKSKIRTLLIRLSLTPSKTDVPRICMMHVVKCHHFCLACPLHFVLMIFDTHTYNSVCLTMFVTHTVHTVILYMYVSLNFTCIQTNTISATHHRLCKNGVHYRCFIHYLFIMTSNGMQEWNRPCPGLSPLCSMSRNPIPLHNFKKDGECLSDERRDLVLSIFK